MRDEFAPELTSSKIQKLYPRRYLTHGSKEKSEPVIVQVKAKVSHIVDKFVYKSSPTGMSHLSLSKNVKTGPEAQKDTISPSLLRSKVVQDLSPRDKKILNPNKEEPSSQGKSSNSEDLKYQTCYRCHKKGHYAVVCPTKQALIETSIEEKTDLSMKSDSSIQSDLLVPSSCVMHLSLSKGVVTGLKEQEFKRKESPDVTLGIDQKMLQDTKLSMFARSKTGHKRRKNESYKLIEVPKKEPDHKLSHEPTLKWKPKSEQSIIQVPKPMNVENFSGCKEESFKEIPPDHLMLLGGSTPKMIRNVATKNLKDHPLQKIINDHKHSRGEILSHLFKEEPPDAPCITKPIFYQGYTVSRSKTFQVGGDVVVTESMVQPESHQTVQTGHLGEGVHPNWNRAKIFTE
uniref:CCHC-type domain-containing protein n=1 Tax=Brassica oleracea TaxID=3712 RepID=A0A3P6EIY2_BRAOL|nr:unnamed protein product [Brassica oleracea]